MPPRERAPQKNKPQVDKERERARVDGGSGRTFEGVHEVLERFSKLEPGKDYEMAELNRSVTAATPIENFFLCGDWTQTGLPATLESAVLSGVKAVEAI